MLSQKQQQKLSQKLSPQQIQLMRLFQIPTFALEERIEEELESNPALEEGEEKEDYSLNEEQDSNQKDDEFDLTDYVDDDDIPEYKLYNNNRSKDNDDKVIPLNSGIDLQEHLSSQLNLRQISEHQKTLGIHLLGNLDEAGYLTRDLDSIVDDLAFMLNIITNEQELEEVLFHIQDLEPIGIGARNLQECLLIQIKKRLTNEIYLKDILNISFKILNDCFDEFTKKHYEKIINKLNINNDILKEAIEEILKLNPKPGAAFSDSKTPVEYILPDFQIRIIDGELELSLNGKNSPELRTNKKYNEMLKAYSLVKGKLSRTEKETITFLKQKIDSAKWFIDAIKQRQNTLYNVMFAIMEFQKEYFMTGDESTIKPMILKDIAEVVQMDISTISRVTSGKFVQTPYGTLFLKNLFSESMQKEDGEEVSTREIKSILKDIIEAEDKKHPYTDEKLVLLLKDKSYNVARRTIAKYREQLNIPVARMRKEM